MPPEEGKAAGPPPPLRRRAAFVVSAAVVVGAIFRAALALPVARFFGEADAVLTGLTAFKILRGRHPVFYGGVRLGALEAYFHAVVFRLAGVSYGALRIAPFAAGLGFVALYVLFARELLSGRRAVYAAALVAIPLLAVSDIASRPIGYDFLLLLGAGTLAFAARRVNGKEPVLSAWLCGAFAGLGLWNNLLSLSVTLPAFLWIGFRARGSTRAAPRIAGGLLFGALPFLAYNAAFPLATFRSSGFPLSPARSLSRILDNARYFAEYDLVELVLGRNSSAPHLGVGVQAVVGAAFAVLVLAASGLSFGRLLPRLRPRALHARLRGPDVWEDLLPALIVAATAALNVLSWVGGIRGATVRYALPVALALPIPLASLLDRLDGWRRLDRSGKGRPGLGIAMLAVALSYSLANARYPALDPERVRRLRAERELVEFLERENVAYAVGDYWDVYAINFLSRERIRAVPGYADQELYWTRLPKQPARLALVAGQPGLASKWAKAAGLDGRVVPFGSGLEAFLPVPNPPSSDSPVAVAWRLNRDLFLLRPEHDSGGMK